MIANTTSAQSYTNSYMPWVCFLITLRKRGSRCGRVIEPEPELRLLTCGYEGAARQGPVVLAESLSVS